MKKILFIFCMVISTFAFSQADTIEIPYSQLVTYPMEFSFRFDVGPTLITNSLADDIEELTVSNGYGGNLGVVYTHHYKGPSMFRMEFTFMHVQTNEKIEDYSYVSDEGKQITYEASSTLKRATYVTLPLFYGLEFSRFYINAGVQGSFIMAGRGYTPFKEISDSIGLEEKSGYAEFDFGIRAGAGVRVAPHWYVETSYYHGLGNICNQVGDTQGQTWNIRALTFGVRYSFHYFKPDPVLKEIRKELDDI